MRCATYVRVSTDQQSTENQRRELAMYLAARGWTLTNEYADEGVSGVKERRPALDELLKDAKRRRFDAVAVWSLDRIGRNLRHLIATLEELQQLGIVVISLRDGLDLSTAAGRLQMAVIGAIAQFERDRLRERTISGLARARAQGKSLGRQPVMISSEDLIRTSLLSIRGAAKVLGVAQGTLRKARLERAAQQTSSLPSSSFAPFHAAIETREAPPLPSHQTVVC